MYSWTDHGSKLGKRKPTALGLKGTPHQILDVGPNWTCRHSFLSSHAYLLGESIAFDHGIFKWQMHVSKDWKGFLDGKTSDDVWNWPPTWQRHIIKI